MAFFDMQIIQNSILKFNIQDPAGELTMLPDIP